MTATLHAARDYGLLRWCLALSCLLCLFCDARSVRSQPDHPPSADRPEFVFIDTDIGDDIDDAFAVTLALQSPELHILGITTTFGDTVARAHLLRRLLTETGHGDLPVAAGPPTQTTNPLTQRPYAAHDRSPDPCLCPGDPALKLFSDAVHTHPHQVTLIALGPLTTVETLIDRDPATFHLLKRVLMMGGSIERGYRHAITGVDDGEPSAAEPEWNIRNDVAGARKLLGSGVPLTLLPLDSTQVPLDELHRQRIFAHGSPATDALTLLYHQWGGQAPTLFDPVTVATILDPQLCPTQPMRLRIDDQGNTRREPAGSPNAQVCLRSDRERFLDLLMTRLLPKDGGSGGCMCGRVH